MIPSTPQIITETRTGNIILEPMRMAKLKVFSEAVEPIIGQIFSMLENKESDKTEESENKDNFNQGILQMINKHYDDLVNLVCVACPAVDKEKIDDMFPDDFVNLVGGVIEVNSDFFVQNLLPMIVERVGSLKAKIPQNLLKNKSGQMDTSVLSPTATD